MEIYKHGIYSKCFKHDIFSIFRTGSSLTGVSKKFLADLIYEELKTLSTMASYKLCVRLMFYLLLINERVQRIVCLYELTTCIESLTFHDGLKLRKIAISSSNKLPWYKISYRHVFIKDKKVFMFKSNIPDKELDRMIDLIGEI